MEKTSRLEIRFDSQNVVQEIKLQTSEHNYTASARQMQIFGLEQRFPYIN